MKAAKARYYSRHNDRLKARQRAYHAAHPEVGVAYIRNIKVADPEKLRVYWRRKRARKLNVSGAHTAEDVYRIYAEQQGRCFWCKEEVGSIYHVDHHMPLSRGGTDDATNLVIACPSCNLRRGNHLPGEWAPEPKTPAR
ncbi:HNH endonuclease [Deinococcus sp.]|uniref:HNH endonuclease n=1 Tax=Deinococcus sp. TaxID=47478 RepID=UPI0025F65918|nr:HNH endonuclease [Deinococcus sp.]